MKSLSILLILGCTQVLSANYYQGRDQGGSGYYNSGYQGSQGYQGQAYYQGSPVQSSQGYYQSSPVQSSQGYYQSSPSQSSSSYYQGSPSQSQGYQRVEQSTPYVEVQKNPNDWSRSESSQQYSNPVQVNTSDWDHKAAVSDEEISRKVKDALSSGWLTKGYPEVTSEVRMGIVTLRGTVDTIENKTKADEAVRKIAGVRGINNQIAVDPNYLKNGESKVDLRNGESKYPQDAAATAEDRLLNAKIREKLNSGWFSKGFDTIILRTSNGIVVISGVVDRNEDVDKVNEQVKNVEGVREVNNQLGVKNK